MTVKRGKMEAKGNRIGSNQPIMVDFIVAHSAIFTPNVVPIIAANQMLCSCIAPLRVIEFYAENIENRSNVTNSFAYIYVDVEDDSHSDIKKRIDGKFRLFFDMEARSRFLHSKSIRCASRQSEMVAPFLLLGIAT